jgi:hypothetical protein
MFALLYLPQHVILGSGYVRKSSVIQSGTLLISKKKKKKRGHFQQSTERVGHCNLVSTTTFTSATVEQHPSTDRTRVHEKTCNWGPGEGFIL